MTERKPPGVSFGSWIDKQINDAIARGEFDNLPGAGKPIADLDRPYDEVWVQRYLRKQGVSTEELLPTPLQLRKEIERLPDTVREVRSEQDVRAVVDELNQRIRQHLRAPSGPQVPVVPVKVEGVLERWRADREAAADAARAGTARRAGTAGTGDREGDRETRTGSKLRRIFMITRRWRSRG